MSKNKKNRFNPQDTNAVENINDTLNTEYEESFDDDIDDVSSESQELDISENIESNDIVNEDTSVQQLQIDNQEDIDKVNTEYVEDVAQDELQPDDSNIEHQNESNVIITNEQKSSNLVLYSVGTDYINGVCINNLITTANLDTAINECTRIRDKQKKSYYVFDIDGKCVFSCVYNTPKDNFYRVGTDWKNGICINQKTTCTNIDEAITISNDNTKSTGMVHRVYDPTGKVVFTSKKKLTLFSYKKREVIKNANWYIK